MNWEAVGALGEVVGAAAVVLTLLYLGRQVKDGSRQIRLNTTSSLTTMSQDSFAPIFFSESNQEIWHSGRDKPESLTEEQFQHFATYMDRVFYAYQLLVTYYEAGAIEEDVFRMQGSYFNYLYNSPGGQRWWQQTPMQFTDRVRFHLGVSDDA